MKNAPENEPSHIVKGDIFDAFGFSASEAGVLKIKAQTLSAILERVHGKGYTQAQLMDILDEHQPSVSNLLKGRISQVSMEKLLRYVGPFASRNQHRGGSPWGASQGRAPQGRQKPARENPDRIKAAPNHQENCRGNVTIELSLKFLLELTKISAVPAGYEMVFCDRPLGPPGDTCKWRIQISIS